MKIIAVMGLALALAGCPSTMAATDAGPMADTADFCGADECASVPGTVCCYDSATIARRCVLPANCSTCMITFDVNEDAGCSR